MKNTFVLFNINGEPIYIVKSKIVALEKYDETRTRVVLIEDECYVIYIVDGSLEGNKKLVEES